MVTEAIIPQALASTASNHSSGSADVAKFMAAYNREAAEAMSVSTEGVGATLLQPVSGLDSGSASLAQQATSLQSGSPRPSDIMELTMRTHEFLFRCELTSNVANRAGDGLQQLFRQQA